MTVSHHPDMTWYRQNVGFISFVPLSEILKVATNNLTVIVFMSVLQTEPNLVKVQA